jgi:hypothetical protein
MGWRRPLRPAHNLLDADGRFDKVVQVAIRVLRRVVGHGARQASRVHVILAEGNHDIASSVWLRQMFAALYENEPRITVEQSPLPYYAIEWGKTLLAFHHGHLKKNDQLPLMFAAQFAEWGRTTKRYCHTGHRHHLEEKEHSGMIVFQHPTLGRKGRLRRSRRLARDALGYGCHLSQDVRRGRALDRKPGHASEAFPGLSCAAMTSAASRFSMMTPCSRSTMLASASG